MVENQNKWNKVFKSGSKLTIVEVDKNYRIVISKEIRKIIPIKPGQKIYLLTVGGEIILIPLPEDVNKELDKLIGDIHWNRKVREEAEKYLLSTVSENIHE